MKLFFVLCVLRVILIKFLEVKKVVWIIVFLIFQAGVFLRGFGLRSEEYRPADLLPQEISGWKAKGEDKTYNPETIFDYIDGAGEVYRSYNFRKLFVRRYTKEGKPEIVVDLFDMGSSKDAFGIFTHDLEGEDAGIGQGSTYKGGLLSFWKDRFFVSLYSEEETEEAKEVLLALGREVASLIKTTGDKPEMISFFPLEKLDKRSLRYFHNHMILNYHFFVADENILLLDQKTEAALGTSREGDERVRLLVIRYPEAKKASDAYKNFMDVYMPDAQEKGFVQTEDMKWTAAKIKNEYLIVVFDALSEAYAKKLAGSVEKKIEYLEEGKTGGD